MMSKKLHITAALLRERGASDEQVTKFKALYPDGAKVYRSGKALQAIADKLAKQGFKTEWAARRFKLTVTCTRSYRNGQLVFCRPYVNGALHGECVSYYPDGQVAYSCTYVNDKRHGELIGYYKDGSIDYSYTYKHGVVV